MTTTSAAKNIAENVTKNIAEVCAAAKTAAAHAALLKRSKTILIVCRTFLRVGQNFISFLDLFKFRLGLFVTLVTVRVVFHGQAFVGLFDFTLFRCFGNA